jgi:hypothetical protein
MLIKWRGAVPPDHPMFTLGTSFVLRSELPEDEHESDDVDENVED